MSFASWFASRGRFGARAITSYSCGYWLCSSGGRNDQPGGRPGAVRRREQAVRRKAVKVEWASQCRYLPDAVKLLSRTIPTFHFRGRRWPLAKPAAAASPARVKLNFVDFRAGKHGMENCGNPPGPGVGGRFSIDQVVARFDQKTCEAPAGDLLV